MNPINLTKEKGSFSEEKAKGKAIDITIADLSRALSKELDDLDWFCRVAKVAGGEVYHQCRKINRIEGGRCHGSISAYGTSRPRRNQGEDSNLGLFWNRCLNGQINSGRETRCKRHIKLSKREGS